MKKFLMKVLFGTPIKGEKIDYSLPPKEKVVYPPSMPRDYNEIANHIASIIKS